ncbi:2Fe-2S iron-sulfur cluster-binding protein [Hyphomicrobium sp. NDB2Meth4]|uniref:2Fe-2S iron-sulfur cluster-binding protein n=1 Tax=Hyphomicrobium sp. NDB2Meth4 TaxID=1892846 RepID=UPI000931D1F3|nr:2Fe-2S iron-sulfur cluster-binding protein [Hyphomicrobium sp. NDB2Meth4]
MPTMTIMPSGKTVDVVEGARVLDALLAAEEGIAHKCDGNAKCGACHIFVHDGRRSLSKVQRAENEKLDTIVGVGSKSRLACQARFGTDNVTVELLGFSSGF